MTQALFALVVLAMGPAIPPQAGQAPNGELNEKWRGSISGNEMPQCTDAAESCWQRNRRDDFVIVTIGSDNIVVPPGGEE
jgi:hypothetical protein